MSLRSFSRLLTSLRGEFGPDCGPEYPACEAAITVGEIDPPGTLPGDDTYICPARVEPILEVG